MVVGSETISSIFTNNPYFSAGAGLIGIGTFLALAKQGVIKYGQFIQRQFLISLEIPSKDKSYYWILQWLSETDKLKRKSNHLSIQTLFKLNENGSSQTYFHFIPSPGIHYLKYKNRWLKLERQREKGSMDLTSGIPFETITLTTIGRNVSTSSSLSSSSSPSSLSSLISSNSSSLSFFNEILIEAKELALKKQKGKIVLYHAWANEWRPFGQPHQKRPFESVILDGTISKNILNDIIEFNGNGKWYYDRGIPYRRGYLLYGPPGTGKSSFIKALAGKLDYNICILNLNESMLTDDRLNYLFNVIPERSFLLLEDIDAAFTDRSLGPSNFSKLTFSGLLNALDGVGSSEERIVFMTTNHYEKLDAALLRPGRVDVQHYLGNATPSQIRQMFLQFYPNENVLADQFTQSLSGQSISPAKIQGHFILFKNDPHMAVSSFSLLFKENTKEG